MDRPVRHLRIVKDDYRCDHPIHIDRSGDSLRSLALLGVLLLLLAAVWAGVAIAAIHFL